MIYKNNIQSSLLSDRRSFLKSCLIGGISVMSLPFDSFAGPAGTEKRKFSLKLDAPVRRFDGKSCWAHPRAGIVPDAGKGGRPRVVMTMNTVDLEGSDVFRGMYGLQTDDLGKNWTTPMEIGTLAPRYEIIDAITRPVAVSDFWPKWHPGSKKLLGIGHTVAYTPEWKVVPERPRDTSWSHYNPDGGTWSSWQKLTMPDKVKFYNAGAGCVQRYDLPDGTILLPFYFKPPGKSTVVTVARCRFDGKTLEFIENGTELTLQDETRGLGEPSLTQFNGEFFLTIRNDKLGFITRSSDGIHYSPIQPWKFDDETDLGSYNTQQHWVTHSDALFLVYTRRGANNDNVFRHRAPLFMSQVNTKTLRVIKSTEVELVPNRGAGLGNFGVTDISPEETWVTTSEWMQPRGVEKFGSDGSVFISRIHWKKPNKQFIS